MGQGEGMANTEQGAALEMTENMESYVHIEPGTKVEGCAFNYTMIEEGSLDCEGREILYYLGEVKVGSHLTGEGRFRFVGVPGYVMDYQYTCDLCGRPVSMIEPVISPKEQESITQLLSVQFPGKQVRY